MNKIPLVLVTILLAGCTGKQVSQVSEETVDTVSVTLDTIPTQIPSITPVEASQSVSKQSVEESFNSAKEAYDEGYYNGQQEGYTDAIHHLEFGYNYNDEPEYSGFLSAYVQGYEDGYTDGYNEGLEWNAEND